MGFDQARYSQLADDNRDAYGAGYPFPHIVIDDFLPADVARAVRDDFAEVEDEWKFYTHFNEKKLALTDIDKMPRNTQRLFSNLQSDEFRRFVSSLTGVDELVPDPSLEGAGMHMIRPGGFLNIHTDFLTHTKQRNWTRHVNMLIYLNPDWEEEWKGNLELWNTDMTECVHSIAPLFNRAVIFNTRPHSYHGHPHRLCCPADRARKSVAIYYYQDAGIECELSSTDYQPLPTDSAMKKILIGADRRLLSLYTRVKSKTGLSDQLLSRLLKRF